MKKIFKALGNLVQRLLKKNTSCVDIKKETGKQIDPQEKKSRLPKYLRKNVNSHRTILPKRIYVKTLLLSVAANQSMDALIMDLSQLESDGIAHYMVSRTINKEALAEEYLAFGGGPMGALAAMVGGDIHTVQVNGAWIWETGGVWDWEEDSSS